MTDNTFAERLTALRNGRSRRVVCEELKVRAGTAVFFKHYRALAVPNSGKKYFAIFP